VCRDEGRDAFDFDNNRIRDQNIRPKPERDRRSFVNHRDTHPAPKGNACALKFHAQHASYTDSSSPGPILGLDRQ
jgi:hypothetical protein